MTGCDGDDAGSQAATGDSQVVELERDFSKVLARVRVTQCGDLRGEACVVAGLVRWCCDRVRWRR